MGKGQIVFLTAVGNEKCISKNDTVTLFLPKTISGAEEG